MRFALKTKNPLTPNHFELESPPFTRMFAHKLLPSEKIGGYKLSLLRRYARFHPKIRTWSKSWWVKFFSSKPQSCKFFVTLRGPYCSNHVKQRIKELRKKSLIKTWYATFMGIFVSDTICHDEIWAQNLKSPNSKYLGAGATSFYPKDAP